MTVLDAQHLTAGGRTLATYANGLETINGLDGAAETRDAWLEETGRDGAAAPGEVFYRPKILPIRLWVAPWDEDGAITHAAGPEGHIRDNLQALLEIFGTSGPIAMTRKVYNGAGPTDIDTLTATAYRRRPIRVGGTRKRYVDVELELRHPFWLGPNVARTGSASHVFTPGGSAPISNMRITMNGAGTYTDHTGATIVTTGACAINVLERTVGGTISTNDRRNRARFNRTWITRWNPNEEVTVTITGTTAAITYNEAFH